MTTSSHSHSTPIPPTLPTPRNSKVILTVILLILGVVVLAIATILWNNRARTYDLRETPYGDILKFKVGAGKTVRVKLTYDYIPMWSSDKIERYNSQGTLATMKGHCISGPCDSSISTHITFVNKSDHSITVKIGRCESKKDCTIDL
jgi:hypothetical protein